LWGTFGTDQTPGFPSMPRDAFNPRQHHYAFAAEDYGLRLVAEVESVFEKASYPHHHYDSFQVLAMVEGRLGMELAGRRWELTPGAILALPPWQPHLPIVDPASRRTVYVDVRVVDRPGLAMAQYLRARDDRPFQHCPGPEFTAAVERLRAAADAPAASLGGVMSAVWALLALLDAEATPAGPAHAAPAGDVRLRVVEAFMQEKLAEPLTIAALAHAAQLSTSQLTRLYRHHMDCAPMQRLRRLRVERATQLLRSGTLSIKQIAALCGFADPNHFSRVYRQDTGRSPRAQRAGTSERPASLPAVQGAEPLSGPAGP
jgi:AraC-like DNA-binding protein/mannose-6-phosphate isomerase-like protein (cupin superfamily)